MHDGKGPLTGHTLSHYRIAAPLGAGGMGEVYRATDTRLGREVQTGWFAEVERLAGR
jgi:serine/threonine protein kinase